MAIFGPDFALSGWRYIYKRVYESVNYRLRFVAGGAWASSCRPVSIVFLMTELCNARCIHCDIWKNRGREENPAPQDYKRTLSDLRAWLGPVQVVFSGGEALLKQYTPELAAHASSIGLFPEVLTHGYWDDQTRVEKLALANPWRITVSLDGIGVTHSRIRGRDLFWEKTTTSLDTLRRLRRANRLGYSIRLKTVIMDQNLDDVVEVARFAAANEMEIFFQSIEQNYNTPDDALWYQKTENWPRDPERAVSQVQALIRLQEEGLPIKNSRQQLEVMIPYFRNPASLRLAVQSHSAHEGRLTCSALIGMQIQANGDVTVCSGTPPVGNIKGAPVREIWEGRPRFWESGCCLGRRATEAEKSLIPLGQIQ